ncbi:hypothetical protein N7532_002777 [Penicillium argentinense]|uniref:F-box domain-containing protein n=1 Tax=Penicillium argentinense TaxID=1131581 RepID=A0A9W9KLU1_9EURO|nr:uncharacterized protein N7532_002777 [Penicillium argentinense]KAJ5110132.1 hypothetical protein N7532_002777 [Penicillium argentinense]
MASLHTLPAEIQSGIFRLLDPASLVSLSQTSKQFRENIRPTRKHFVERLLQLECDETKGGVTPRFNARNNQLSPDWTQPEWKAMRWACSGCLRLLPHESFDNHSILRLAYRKPIPGSPAAEDITSWEISPKINPRLPHLRRDNRIQKLPTDEMKIRRRYSLAISNKWSELPSSPIIRGRYIELQGCDWTVFENKSISEFTNMEPEQKKVLFDQEVKAIEQVRCGNKRHLRKCHECRYKSGQLKPSLKGSDGVARIPLTTARQYRIPTPLDRVFPHFWEMFKNKRPDVDPPAYAVYRQYSRDRFYPMLMIRCPDCEDWKEARMFEMGSIHARWQLDEYQPYLDDSSLGKHLTATGDGLSRGKFDGLRCHACYARKYGREALGLEVTRSLKKILSRAELGLRQRLGDGWRILLAIFDSDNFPKRLLKELHDIVDEPNKLAHEEDRKDAFTAEELAFFRERYECFMKFRQGVIDNENAQFIHDGEHGVGTDWNYLWTHMYGDMENFYKWIVAVQVEVEQKPEKLADWALGDSIKKMPPVTTAPYVRKPW